MLTRRAALSALLAAPWLGRAAAQGEAGDYPNRPIRVILPYSAGGQADTIGRTIQPRMSEALGQTVVIENRTGAGGSIGAGIVAAAAPDGYTLLLDSAAFLIVPLAVRNLAFDYETAFAPIGFVAEQPYVLAVTPEMGVSDLAGFLAAVRASGESLPFGTPGVGSIGHLAGALLASRAGVPLEHVSYRGGAEVARDLAAGTLKMGLITFNSLTPVIQSGRAKALAVTSGIRRGDLSVPTIAESGFPGFDVTSWNALFAPAGTPGAVIRKLAAACNHATSDAWVRQRLAGISSEPNEAQPDTAATRIAAEREVVKSVVREARIVFQ
jgi:tripartite-type tricarboxylate transporter receptor subunit TctC